jgi:AraC family transcriptional regulator
MEWIMKLNYSLPASLASRAANNTPGLASQRLPFHTTSAGHFSAGGEYFTEREGMENSCLLFYTLAGRGLLRYRGGEWGLYPGQAAIINCFEYQYYATAEEPWEFKWIHIGGGMAAEYEARINAGSLRRVALGGTCRTGAALDAVLALLEDRGDPLADVKISGAISDMLTELASFAGRGAPDGKPRRGEIDAALVYIRENYRCITGVDEIAAHAGMSKYYFLRVFKAHTGTGPYECLNNHRIDAAKRLLKEGGRKVGETALAVGFNDVNCFIRYFKKVTGVTPAVYQKYYLY